MFKSGGNEIYLNKKNEEILKDIINENLNSIKNFINTSFESITIDTIKEFRVVKIYMNNIINLNDTLKEEYNKLIGKEKEKYELFVHSLGNLSTVFKLTSPTIKSYFELGESNQGEIDVCTSSITNSIKKLEEVLNEF